MGTNIRIALGGIPFRHADLPLIRSAHFSIELFPAHSQACRFSEQATSYPLAQEPALLRVADATTIVTFRFVNFPVSTPEGVIVSPPSNLKPVVTGQVRNILDCRRKTGSQERVFTLIPELAGARSTIL